MTKIIVDPGSTHLGIKDNCYKIIDAAKEAGADAVKFQLFKDIPPNIPLPYEWWGGIAKRGRETGIEVFASIWDKEGIELLREHGATSIKFSYIQSQNLPLIDEARMFDFSKYFFSYDMMNRPLSLIGNNDKWLYCIPEYPVKYIIDFDAVFRVFDGFSDHTYGISQTINAVNEGAEYIEKHFTLQYGANCPDERFAINPKELKILRGTIGDENFSHR